MTMAQPPDRASASPRHALKRASSDVGEGAAPVLPGAGVLTIGLAGLVLGLSATALVLDRGWDPGSVTIGPWVTRLRVGTPAIDPYAAAALARSGAVPLAANEGLSFTAATDDTGYRLIRTCSYRIGDMMPPARYWTLTAADPPGQAMTDPARLSALTSTSVIRDVSGAFSITVGAGAAPGNWLPVTGAGPLTLTLRLYGTPLATDAGDVAAAHLPSIDRQSCAAQDQAATSGMGAGDRERAR